MTFWWLQHMNSTACSTGTPYHALQAMHRRPAPAAEAAPATEAAPDLSLRSPSVEVNSVLSGMPCSPGKGLRVSRQTGCVPAIVTGELPAQV